MIDIHFLRKSEFTRNSMPERWRDKRLLMGCCDRYLLSKKIKVSKKLKTRKMEEIRDYCRWVAVIDIHFLRK